jgi:glycosyltransferase involved in cell wall biosynthesis
MKVLFVTESVPQASSGGSVATMGVLRALRRGGFDIHLVVNARPRHLGNLEVARSLASTLTVVPRPRMRVTPLADWARCMAVHRYVPRWQAGVLDALLAALRSERYDLVFLEQIRTAEYGRLLKERGVSVPVALREHNVEHELNTLLAPEMDAAQERLETRLRAHRYRAIETHLARYCDLILPISAVDGAKLGALNPGLPVGVIPSPVDTDHYRPAPFPPPGKEIVFVGGMGYTPNRDAVTWFSREIFPLVLARHPDARLVAIGEKPPELLREHGDRAVAPGFVPDERVFVARGRVFIAPIRYGSGVRTKILNALAMERPVVATTLGAEGLELAPGRELLVADEPAPFADAVSALLEDEPRATALASAGLRACLDGYSPERVGERLRAAMALVHGERRAG